METKNVQQHIQSVIDNMDIIVRERPYHAFPLLAIIIELLGKCLNENQDWQHFEHGGGDFKKALECDSLKKYINLDFSLYDVLRCGMAHAFMPKERIKLTPDNNDLANNIIGCKELYEDIITAWNSIVNGTIKPAKDLSVIITNIDGPTTSITPYIASQPIRQNLKGNTKK